MQHSPASTGGCRTSRSRSPHSSRRAAANLTLVATAAVARYTVRRAQLAIPRLTPRQFLGANLCACARQFGPPACLTHGSVSFVHAARSFASQLGDRRATPRVRRQGGRTRHV